MKPTVRLASTKAPDGTELVLAEHDGEYTIRADGYDLMTSRQNESEIALGRLGCARLVENRNAVVLIGGLGMGFTLRAVLDMLRPEAKVVVAELLPDIIEWNRGVLGPLAGNPLDDPRVTVVAQDVLHVIRNTSTRFDAIILDIDNGPDPMVDRENRRLYSRQGIHACCEAMHTRGVLCVWSASPDRTFERRLQREHMFVRRIRVPAYKGSRNQFHNVWCASATRHSVPLDVPEPEERPEPAPRTARPQRDRRKPARGRRPRRAPKSRPE